jgi:hypothetical protein
MMIKVNLVLVTIAILILSIMAYVYAHAQDYMKGYKLEREDGKTGAAGYGSVMCSVSTSKRRGDKNESM